MLSRESAIAKFIDEYDIEVPQDRVNEKCDFLLLNYRRKKMYSLMTNQPDQDFFEHQDPTDQLLSEIKQTAFDEVKKELVINKILEDHDFPVSDEETIDYANNMMQTANASMEMISKLFGDDLSMTRDAVRRIKAENWILEQISK